MRMDEHAAGAAMPGAGKPEPGTESGPGPRSNPGFVHWLVEGARTLLFKRPRWERLHVTPARLALLALLDLALSCAVQRSYIDGAAQFHWNAATAGWVHTVLLAWACYLLAPRARSGEAHLPSTLSPAAPSPQPGAARLLALLFGQAVCITVYGGLLFLVLLRSGALAGAEEWVHWLAWLAPVVWILAASITALLREAPRAPAPARLFALAAVLLSAALAYLVDRPPAFWSVTAAVQANGANGTNGTKGTKNAKGETPAAPSARADETPAAAGNVTGNAAANATDGADGEPADEGIHLTQEVFEAQAPLLGRQLAALAPQRPGVIDMYTLTFAPFEGEEVFRRESRMVADVMARRFDAAGRGLQLINHKDTAAELPWATPLNMERAIAGMAKVMDRDEDVLFIHLTSHGAANGELAADFWPMDVEPVVPAALKYWLDKAGIRHRVISISACYAGNWVKPLAGADTLVMTASDADHTSYGCGKKSELTFFGRAMYDEQLRSTTLSFEEAHAAARKVILQREKEAGKDDGYSNPQIKAGKRIVATLQRQREQLTGH